MTNTITAAEATPGEHYMTPRGRRVRCDGPEPDAEGYTRLVSLPAGKPVRVPNHYVLLPDAEADNDNSLAGRPLEEIEAALPSMSREELEDLGAADTRTAVLRMVRARYDELMDTKQVSREDTCPVCLQVLTLRESRVTGSGVFPSHAGGGRPLCPGVSRTPAQARELLDDGLVDPPQPVSGDEVAPTAVQIFGQRVTGNDRSSLVHSSSDMAWLKLAAKVPELQTQVSREIERQLAYLEEVEELGSKLVVVDDTFNKALDRLGVMRGYSRFDTRPGIREAIDRHLTEAETMLSRVDREQTKTRIAEVQEAKAKGETPPPKADPLAEAEELAEEQERVNYLRLPPKARIEELHASVRDSRGALKHETDPDLIREALRLEQAGKDRLTIVRQLRARLHALDEPLPEEVDAGDTDTDTAGDYEPTSTKLDRDTCPCCDRDVALRKGGELREHQVEPGGVVCAGTGLTVQAAQEIEDAAEEAKANDPLQGWRMAPELMIGRGPNGPTHGVLLTEGRGERSPPTWRVHEPEWLTEEVLAQLKGHHNLEAVRGKPPAFNVIVELAGQHYVPLGGMFSLPYEEWVLWPVWRVGELDVLPEPYEPMGSGSYEGLRGSYQGELWVCGGPDQHVPTILVSKGRWMPGGTGMSATDEQVGVEQLTVLEWAAMKWAKNNSRAYDQDDVDRLEHESTLEYQVADLVAVALDTNVRAHAYVGEVVARNEREIHVAWQDSDGDRRVAFSRRNGASVGTSGWTLYGIVQLADDPDAEQEDLEETPEQGEALPELGEELDDPSSMTLAQLIAGDHVSKARALELVEACDDPEELREALKAIDGIKGPGVTKWVRVDDEISARLDELTPGWDRDPEVDEDPEPDTSLHETEQGAAEAAARWRAQQTDRPPASITEVRERAQAKAAKPEPEAEPAHQVQSRAELREVLERIPLDRLQLQRLPDGREELFMFNDRQGPPVRLGDASEPHLAEAARRVRVAWLASARRKLEDDQVQAAVDEMSRQPLVPGPSPDVEHARAALAALAEGLPALQALGLDVELKISTRREG